MTEENRPKGRPPKVRPEATLVSDQAEPTEVLEQMIEVELIRKYAPDGQPQEIKKTVPPGTVMELPKAEAVRLLKLGLAHATDRTFG